MHGAITVGLLVVTSISHAHIPGNPEGAEKVEFRGVELRREALKFPRCLSVVHLPASGPRPHLALPGRAERYRGGREMSIPGTVSLVILLVGLLVYLLKLGPGTGLLTIIPWINAVAGLTLWILLLIWTLLDLPF